YLAAYPGENHAIVGDNGAGKSTMLKIMCGLYRADAGEILIDGQAVSVHGAAEAHSHGLGVVYQDLALVESLDVSTNMALGNLPRRGRILLNRRRMDREAAAVLDDLEVRVGSVKTAVGLLSGGERQIVAIARAVRRDTPIVLLDEPTAALGVRETANVGEILRQLRGQRKAIICISHDLEFVFGHADRISVMRLGNTVGTRAVADTTKDEIVGMITGTVGPVEQ
ncbi:MAG: ribose transport system ATP-binding protein, partial [Gaiellaceae bacterium]|nr:ribose transport system ATP-binding protein [Gaiellaceae bacterium]